MRKILTLIICIILFSSTSWVSAMCDYYELLVDCREKNDSGTAYTATDYLCTSSENDEEILYNIILDKKFGVVDKKIDDYISWLAASKNYYFWAEKRSSFFQWVDIIGLKFGRFWEYWQEYNAICDVSQPNGILSETLACLDAEDGDDNVTRTSLENATTFFEWSSCIQLAERNLSIHELVAYDLMKVNKAAIRRDNRTIFMQVQRDKYENLLNLMRVNDWYLERIWKKWPSKTRDVY